MTWLSAFAVCSFVGCCRSFLLQDDCQGDSCDPFSTLALRRTLSNRKLDSELSSNTGCATEYGGCNCGPCCETFASMGCTEYDNDSAMAFFQDGDTIYGTVAAGTPGSTTAWTTCGACYSVTLGPNCSTLDYSSGVGECTVAPSDWGCQANDLETLSAAGTKAIVMVTNQCSECYTGHFDFCLDSDFGNTTLYGMDNPMVEYTSVDCPAILLERLGCPTDTAAKKPSTVSTPCTPANEDRYYPKLGGCCPDLEECVEERPRSNSAWCEPADPRNGKTCWSHIVMCRTSCSE